MDPSEERDDDVERLVRARRLATGCRTAARRALRLARRYRAEEGRAGGDREKACIAQALVWRRTAREVVAGDVSAVTRAARPGLARARAEAAEAAAPVSPRTGTR